MNVLTTIQRRQILKGKSYAEKVRIRAEFRRQDAKAAEEKRQREEKEHAEKIAKLERKAEIEELKERREKSKAHRRALRQSGRPRFSGPALRISPRAFKLPR